MKRSAVVEIDGYTHWTISGEHRCSRKHCTSPAVAVLSRRTKRGAYGYRRYFCTDHLAELRRFVRSGKVWMGLDPDAWLTSLSSPWPPPRYREVAP